MPIEIGAKPAITIGGTTDVNIVAWDSTTTGRVVVLSQTGTQTVNVVVSTAIAMSGTGNVTLAGQPIGISGTVTGIVAASGTQNVIVVNTADSFNIPTGGSVRYNGTSTNVNSLYLAITTSAAVILVTSAASKVVIVSSLWVNGNTVAAFKLQSATTDVGTLFIATSGVGMVLGHNDHGWNRTTAGQSLVASAAASGSYSGWLNYFVISG